MNRAVSIQSRIAIFLLVLFAVSITPKVVFHHVLTEHKDTPLCQDSDKTSPHFHHPVFHCSFDDLVVTSPYLATDLPPAPERPFFYTEKRQHFSSFTLSFPLLLRESRGPPLM